ncbi:MAG: helix-turn-helix domain-containing protein [Opitutaceae bacterium]|nr:helix-turn-helix domain-containing protein [Opitutaceae bacterium]
MKIEDASVALGGVSAETIRRFVAKGKLHPIRKHRHMVFSVEELQRFLREETSDEDDSR